MSIREQLFKALDDEIKYQYFLYEKGKGKYPCRLSIEALLNAEEIGVGKSEALKKMYDNLVKDILKELP